MTDFKQIISIQPPFDKRNADPNKDYGIGGLLIRFMLLGPKGATQFVYSTAQYQKHVADEFWNEPRRKYNPFTGMAFDIGYHSPVAQYERQKSRECDLLPEGKCFYDGSSLQASEFEERFLQDGEEAVWPMLRERYNELFEPK